MIKVANLSANTFPIEFLEVLPDRCECCGEPTYINATLKTLRCSNPKCTDKVVQRLLVMLQDLGVKNMGESRCRDFLTTYGLENPYCIFMYEPTDGVLGSKMSMDFSQQIFDQLKDRRDMLLWEYVKIGNLPRIRDNARKIFSDYDNLDSFYNDFEDPVTGGVDFICRKLNIKVKDAVESISAVHAYETLKAFKEDLYEVVDFVNIKKLNTPVINICMSTAVGAPYKSKQDFSLQMNKEFGEKVHLNVLSSVTQDLHALIWAGNGNPTTKAVKALNINEKRRAENIANGVDSEEGLIFIGSGLLFKQWLEEQY